MWLTSAHDLPLRHAAFNVEETRRKEHETGPNNVPKMEGKVQICYNFTAEESVTILYVNVAYLLTARTVEPAKGSETLVSRQRLGKHVPAATEVLLKPVFSAPSVQKG
jgi:hypothetical protein